MKEKEDEKIPLKTILQNFLNHVETLEAKKDEGEDLYDKEFQVFPSFSSYCSIHPDVYQIFGEEESQVSLH